jgi:hypothetical protein
VGVEKKLFGALRISAIATVLVSLAYGTVVAAEKKKTEAATPACKSFKEEAACQGRDDCGWVAASVDAKTGKEKRRAYCRTKPKTKTKT